MFKGSRGTCIQMTCNFPISVSFTDSQCISWFYLHAMSKIFLLKTLSSVFLAVYMVLQRWHKWRGLKEMSGLLNTWELQISTPGAWFVLRGGALCVHSYISLEELAHALGYLLPVRMTGGPSPDLLPPSSMHSGSWKLNSPSSSFPLRGSWSHFISSAIGHRLCKLPELGANPDRLLSTRDPGQVINLMQHQFI